MVQYFPVKQAQHYSVRFQRVKAYSSPKTILAMQNYELTIRNIAGAVKSRDSAAGYASALLKRNLVKLTLSKTAYVIFTILYEIVQDKHIYKMEERKVLRKKSQKGESQKRKIILRFFTFPFFLRV